MTDHKLNFGNKRGEIVNLSKLAELFGVGRDTIMTWTDNGMPEIPQPRGVQKRSFDTAACFKWKASYEIKLVEAAYKLKLATQVTEDPSKMDKAEAERRKAVAGALTAELDLAKAREQVANIADLMLNFDSALVNVRAKLVSSPNRMSGLLAHQDEEEVFKILTKDIASMLEDLSDYTHEYVEAERGD